MKTKMITIIIMMLLIGIAGCKSRSVPAEAIVTLPFYTQTFTVQITQTATAISTVYSEELVSVPGGTFTQTDTNANSFSHTISAFKLGKYEVRYELWYTVYQWAILPAQGYTFANEGCEGIDGTPGAAPTSAKNEPVTTINWRDIIVWCNAFSQMTGLTPVYYSDAGFTTPIKNSTDGIYGNIINTIPGSFDNPYENWSANGYRLPTEGEWQYAASYQDGSSWTPYNFASGAGANYTDSAACTTVAWYMANSGNVTHNVGDVSKMPNALGIYDMSGNVSEWCWDSSGSYPTAAVSDYRGPALNFGCVVRGGSCFDIPNYLQVGERSGAAQYEESGINGFRLARNN